MAQKKTDYDDLDAARDVWEDPATQRVFLAVVAVPLGGTLPTSVEVLELVLTDAHTKALTEVYDEHARAAGTTHRVNTRGGAVQTRTPGTGQRSGVSTEQVKAARNGHGRVPDQVIREWAIKEGKRAQSTRGMIPNSLRLEYYEAHPAGGTPAGGKKE